MPPVTGLGYIDFLKFTENYLWALGVTPGHHLVGNPTVSGTEPLEELEEMILSRFSKVRLGQGQERGPDRPGGRNTYRSMGIQGCNVTPPRSEAFFFGIVKGSWWFS